MDHYGYFISFSNLLSTNHLINEFSVMRKKHFLVQKTVKYTISFENSQKTATWSRQFDEFNPMPCNTTHMMHTEEFVLHRCSIWCWYLNVDPFWCESNSNPLKLYSQSFKVNFRPGRVMISFVGHSPNMLINNLPFVDGFDIFIFKKRNNN